MAGTRSGRTSSARRASGVSRMVSPEPEVIHFQRRQTRPGCGTECIRSRGLANGGVGFRRRGHSFRTIGWKRRGAWAEAHATQAAPGPVAGGSSLNETVRETGVQETFVLDRGAIHDFGGARNLALARLRDSGILGGWQFQKHFEPL